MKAEGESLDSIRNHFMKRGLPETQIDNIIQEAIAKEQREEDKERVRSKQMMLVGILAMIGGITGLLLDHYLFDDMQLLMIVSFMLVLFGIANIVYGMFRNPDRKKKREERKNQQATA